MWKSDAPDITQRLKVAADGDQTAMKDVMEAVYDELHRLANKYMRGNQGHTLQATALINEAYLRLARERDTGWNSREHFMAVAATAMRQIVVDYSRKRNAEKRGGAMQRVTLDGKVELGVKHNDFDMVQLDQVLSKLEALDPQHAKLVTLRVFGGLTVPEIAEVLGISPRTVNNHWRFCKAWLRRELTSQHTG